MPEEPDDPAPRSSDEYGAVIAEHEACRWVAVPPCVYCADHDVRLYQGGLPESRREASHEHDWDYDSGLGFYYVCRTCGEREWTE